MSRKGLSKRKQIETEQRKEQAVWKPLLSYFVVAFFFLLWGTWALPVTDPVESNYALTAKEMVQTGNWMSPQIYHTFWYDKPIMVYWLLSLSYSVLGFTDLASRLPSVLMGALSVTLLIYYVNRITKNNIIATWSGIMLSLSLEFWVISHGIITDSILLFFTIPTMLSAYIGLTEGMRKHFIIAYASAGFACLTKGPVGLVLPGILLILYLLISKNPKDILRLFPWQGILAFFAVVLPWYGGMVLIHGTDFITQFLGIHNVLRATSSEHPKDNHFYYYFVLFPLSLLPWTGASFYEMWKGWKEKHPFYLFLMTWCFGTLLFYTLMATKYVTYTYIAIVPAIILAAFAAPKIREGEKAPTFATIASFFVLVAALTAGTFYVKDGNWWVFYIVVVYALFALGLRYTKSEGKRLTIMTAVTASLFMSVILEGLPGYLHHRSTVDWANEVDNLPGNYYFFYAYPASYTFYTDQIGIRFVPSETSMAGEEKRNPLWNEKYVMPSAQDTDFFAESPKEPSYLIVTKSQQGRFDHYADKDKFTFVKDFGEGKIYVYQTPSDETQKESSQDTEDKA